MHTLRSKITLAVGGMTCENCKKRITAALMAAPGVLGVSVSLERGTAEVIFDADRITETELIRILEGLGYQARRASAARPAAGRTAALLAVIFGLYALVERAGLLNLLVPARLAQTGMGYAALFFIGLLTSVHCIAMCGGINLSQCLPRAESAGDAGALQTLKPALLYNLGRVVSYTAVGAALGLAGMALGGGAGLVSPLLQGVLKLLAGALMVVMGLNLLGIAPRLRRFSPRLPGFLATRIEREKAAGRGPFVVGLLNGLMPCGPLQAMQLAALASGSAAAGALSMLAFSLGTVPLMLGLGSLVSALGRRFARQVMGAGAVLVAALGLAMAVQGVRLAGFGGAGFAAAGRAAEAAVQSTQTAFAENAQPAAGAAAAAGTPENASGAAEDGVQVIRSTLSARQYPDITVQAGMPVRWIIDAPAGSVNGCNYRMLLTPFGRQVDLHEGENIVEFTPEQSGAYGYSCWMGMVYGSVTVTEPDGSLPAQTAPESPAPAPAAPGFAQGGCPMCAAAPAAY